MGVDLKQNKPRTTVDNRPFSATVLENPGSEMSTNLRFRNKALLFHNSHSKRRH